MTQKAPEDERISTLTVLEAVDLAKMLEEKWGVLIGDAAGAEPAASSMHEHGEISMVLVAVGDRRPDVVEAVRNVAGVSLARAEDLVARAPIVLVEGITEGEASKRLERLSSAGAQVLLVRAGPEEVKDRLDGRPVRRPVTDFRREAESIGVPVAPQPDPLDASDVVSRIAASSRDLFPDDVAAKTFLFDHPIDDSGRTAVALVQERGAAALLIKLDQMRFGANG